MNWWCIVNNVLPCLGILLIMGILLFIIFYSMDKLEERFPTHLPDSARNCSKEWSEVEERISESRFEQIERDRIHDERVAEVRRYKGYGYDDEELKRKYTSEWGYTEGNKIVKEANRSSDFCYIANASINGFMPLESLVPLKHWRYTVLEKSSIGLFFSNIYRRKAPAIAKKISSMPTACKAIRKFFVIPALHVLRQRKGFRRDFVMWVLFLTLMVTTKVMTTFKK